MERKTVVEMLTLLKAEHYGSFKDMPKDLMRLKIETWYENLKAYSDNEVIAAFKIALSEMDHQPKVANILAYIRRAKKLSEPSDFELWGTTRAAVERLKVQRWDKRTGFYFLYKAKNEECKAIYDGLPEAVRRYYDFNTFCELAEFDEEKLYFTRSAFLKAIGEIRAVLRERELIAGNNLLQIKGDHE